MDGLTQGRAARGRGVQASDQGRFADLHDSWTGPTKRARDDGLLLLNRYRGRSAQRMRVLLAATMLLGYRF